MAFRQHGKQFLFYTFCLAGRPQALSRLEKGEKLPLLSAEGEAVHALMRALHRLDASLTASPPSLAGLWEDRFWMDLSLSSRQLAAIRAYIRGNPARALWKREHPDAFIRHAGFRHRALDPGERWSAYGCLPLLASPFLFHLRLTRRIPVEGQEEAIAAAVEKARGGWIPVGGFLSPAEKEAERRLRAEPRARYVKFLPHGLAPRFDPSLADSRLLAEGRLLILSPFPETVPVSPISRANCERMNSLAADTAARAAIQEPEP